MIISKSSSLSRMLAFSALSLSICLSFNATAAQAKAATKTAVNAAAKTATTVSVEPRFLVGKMLVERRGTHGAPLILIPGLASGAWVWADTVKQLQDTHVVYVVTLPGFNGVPASEGRVMKEALLSLKGLILTQKLDKPVLIGHSLGGVLALALAENEPSLISGVISIDGLPVFPGTDAMPLAQRPAMAESIKASMAGQDASKFAEQQLQYMQHIGVLDGAMAEKLAKLSARSDPAASAEYMAETLALDLRPELAKISVPVLVISPYNAPDGATQNLTEQAKTDYYRTLMKGTPKFDVVSIAPARHFVMFDQPKQVDAAIDNYLKSVGAP